MYMIRQCECGCNQFEKEPDDDVMRCAECWKRAVYEYIPEGTDIEAEDEK